MAPLQRVVVTGMGTINPIGQSLEEFWSNAIRGTSGVKRVTDFPIPPRMSQIAGIVDGFDAGPGARLGEGSSCFDRSLRFALAAAEAAVAQAGIGQPGGARLEPARCAVCVSTAIAHISRMEAAFCRQSRYGTAPIRARGEYVGPHNSFFFNTTSAELARRFGFRGGAVTIATGCTGGVDAVGAAMQTIRHGQADVVLTGATEAPITPLVVAAFGQIGATSTRNDDPPRASRPFDIDRDGFVLAEGCGILVLESLEHALGRGARILAEITGFGSVNNCYHMTDIPEDGQSIARACVAAIEDADVDRSRIDFVNAHGSSTPQNDVAEANALRSVFGERSRHIPVTSIKSQTGHALSAANSIEIISSVLSITEGVIPPTINVTRLDERCPLDVVANDRRSTDVTCVLKVSSGFSGIHSCLVVEQYPNERGPHHA